MRMDNTRANPGGGVIPALLIKGRGASQGWCHIVHDVIPVNEKFLKMTYKDWKHGMKTTWWGHPPPPRHRAAPSLIMMPFGSVSKAGKWPHRVENTRAKPRGRVIPTPPPPPIGISVTLEWVIVPEDMSNAWKYPQRISDTSYLWILLDFSTLGIWPVWEFTDK